MLFLGCPYFSATSFNSFMMIVLTRVLLARMASSSSMSFSSVSISCVRFKMYSLLRWRSLISATYSAWISSMPKPIIRLGTTSSSSAVSRTMRTALSISSKISLSPLNRCSLSFFLLKSKWVRRLTHSTRKAVHSSKSSRTPSTRGTPAIRTLKLQAKLSSSGVILYRRCISLSGSAPRFKSIVIFRPSKPVSSRTSAISLILPAFTISIIFSMIVSQVVVGAIPRMSMQFADLS